MNIWLRLSIFALWKGTSFRNEMTSTRGVQGEVDSVNQSLTCSKVGREWAKTLDSVDQARCTNPDWHWFIDTDALIEFSELWPFPTIWSRKIQSQSAIVMRVKWPVFTLEAKQQICLLLWSPGITQPLVQRQEHMRNYSRDFTGRSAILQWNERQKKTGKTWQNRGLRVHALFPSSLGIQSTPTTNCKSACEVVFFWTSFDEFLSFLPKSRQKLWSEMKCSVITHMPFFRCHPTKPCTSCGHKAKHARTFEHCQNWDVFSNKMEFANEWRRLKRVAIAKVWLLRDFVLLTLPWAQKFAK